MPTLPPSTIADLLVPYLAGAPVSSKLYDQLAAYLDLLTRWNARTNLTTISSPEEIVCRHFGESLFAARHLPASANLLDLGSGAGFPGLPIQFLHPDLSVTLAESQNKKASFLREVVRTLNLSTKVWAARAEAMAFGAGFDTVALRAVDRMEQAVAVAAPLARQNLMVLTTVPQVPLPPPNFIGLTPIRIPVTNYGVLQFYKRSERTGPTEATLD